MRKAQERQARNYDKRRSAVTFEPGDLVLVDTYALRGAQDGVRQGSLPPVGWSRLLSVHVSTGWHTRWSYLQNGDTIKLLTLGSLRNLGSQLHFRGRCRKATSRGPAALSQDATEILETRTTTRRGRTRQEFLGKWPGECQAMDFFGAFKGISAP